MHDYEDQEHALTTSLRQIAAMDGATSGASPAVRERLLEEVRTLRHARRAALIKMYSLAAGLVVATAMPVWQLSTRPGPDVSMRATRATGDSEVATVFYPLKYSDLPVTHGNLVRLALPPAAFAALGVEPLDWIGPQPDTVLADVLVGEDGLARAVRFVRPAANGYLQEQLP
jgi:hypothetical protein